MGERSKKPQSWSKFFSKLFLPFPEWKRRPGMDPFPIRLIGTILCNAYILFLVIVTYRYTRYCGFVLLWHLYWIPFAFFSLPFATEEIWEDITSCSLRSVPPAVLLFLMILNVYERTYFWFNLVPFRLLPAAVILRVILVTIQNDWAEERRRNEPDCFQVVYPLPDEDDRDYQLRLEKANAERAKHAASHAATDFFSFTCANIVFFEFTNFCEALSPFLPIFSPFRISKVQTKMPSLSPTDEHKDQNVLMSQQFYPISKCNILPFATEEIWEDITSCSLRSVPPAVLLFLMILNVYERTYFWFNLVPFRLLPAAVILRVILVTIQNDWAEERRRNEPDCFQVVYPLPDEDDRDYQLRLEKANAERAKYAATLSPFLPIFSPFRISKVQTKMPSLSPTDEHKDQNVLMSQQFYPISKCNIANQQGGRQHRPTLLPAQDFRTTLLAATSRALTRRRSSEPSRTEAPSISGGCLCRRVGGSGTWGTRDPCRGVVGDGVGGQGGVGGGVAERCAGGGRGCWGGGLAFFEREE
ncbi:hypothetical protein BT69DRAFT_1397436, partial [Atractiella rhizophila]